jgi:Ca-activated chloride channel family protein
MRYAVSFTNVDVLAGVVRGRAWRRYVPPILFLLALTALAVGLARPRVATQVATNRSTVILVVDSSRSMEAQDVRPTRLGAARAAMRTFLEHAPSKLRVGIVVFAGDAQVAAPPTTDRDLLRSSIDAIGDFPGFGGTAIGDALAAAVELAIESTGSNAVRSLAAERPTGGTQGPVSILFLSDGHQTRGNLQPLEGAARAKAAGVPVYTIALGTPNGVLKRTFGPFQRSVPVPPDPDTLRAIAQRTGGRFFNATSAEALQSAYAKLGSSLGRVPGRSEVTYAFVAGAAALLVAAGLLSAFWSPRLP